MTDAKAEPVLGIPLSNDQLLEASIFLAMLAAIGWIAWSDRGLRMYYHSGLYRAEGNMGDSGDGGSVGHGSGDCGGHGGGDGCGH